MDTLPAGLTIELGPVEYLDPRAQARAAMQAERRAITNAIPILDTEVYARLVKRLLRSTSKIVVTGVGKSAIAARKTAATLATCGVQAVFVDPIGLYHGELGLLVPGDVVLMISHSGETEELVRLLPVLQEKRCEIYSLLSRGASTLGSQTYAMVTGVESEPFLKIPTASSAAAVAVGNALAIEVALRRGYDDADFAQNHPGGHIGQTYRQAAQ